MAAILDVGGARSAPRVVWRTLLRVVLLSGLTAVAWLLGSGIGHADEDLGLPGTGLINAAMASHNGPSNDAASDDGFGTPASVVPTVKAVVPTVKKALSTAPVPVRPPVQVSVLRPIVQAVDIAKPLDQILPVSRPIEQNMVTVSPPAQVGKPVTAAVPTVAGQSAALTPVAHAAPAVLCSPTPPVVKPVTVQPVLGGGPASPIPANPPGTTTSLCAIGAGTGGAGNKNGPDVAVHDSWVPAGLAQPYDLLDRDTSGLPRSLSVQPSTSPD